MNRPTKLFDLTFAAIVLAAIWLASSVCCAQMFELPAIEDDDLRRAIAEADLWYDHQTMPPAFQFAGPSPSSEPSIHSPRYNLAGPLDATGNGNSEFPWHHPGGTDDCPGILTNTFIDLPDGKPIVLYRRRTWKLSVPGFINAWAWSFPPGAVVGEILMLRRPADVSGEAPGIVFEIRTRTREEDDWGVDIHRPFASAAELAAVFGRLQTQPLTARSRHSRPGFAQRGETIVLPAIARERAAEELRRRSFRSVLGLDLAYTQYSQDFHVVPRGYFSGLLGGDRTGCVNCHQDTGKSVDHFDPGRDWYGLIRGSDRIFSFHPFDRRVISTNGGRVPVRLNEDLFERGIVELYDRNKHGEYRRLP